jgi:hypothetical protein
MKYFWYQFINNGIVVLSKTNKEELDYFNVIYTKSFNSFEELVSYFKSNLSLPKTETDKRNRFESKLSDDEMEILKDIYNNYKELL